MLSTVLTSLHNLIHRIAARGAKQNALSILLFFAHQIFGTMGIGLLAYLTTAEAFDLYAHFAHPQSMRPVHWILTETPYFPVQIVLAWFSGLYIARVFSRREMLWIWVIPTLVLIYGMMNIPNIATRPGVVSSLNPWSHFFGWGCNVRDYCLDQLLITLPFYESIAYSFGALLGIHHPFAAHHASDAKTAIPQ